MSEVVQTILLNDPSGRPGNCLQAAVASLLDLELDAVPHFVESPVDWFADMAVFARGHGYELMQHSPSHEPPVFGLAFGFTNRSAERHAVVYRDGVMVWDPHPSRDGLTSVRTYVDFDPIAAVATRRRTGDGMTTTYPGRETEHDLGDGHSFVWMQDGGGQTIGLIEHHPKGPDATPGARYCGGYVAWIPEEAQRGVHPAWVARHQLVAGGPGDEANLTLAPSLQCRHCPSHGFIRNGQWVPA